MFSAGKKHKVQVLFRQDAYHHPKGGEITTEFAHYNSEIAGKSVNGLFLTDVHLSTRHKFRQVMDSSDGNNWIADLGPLAGYFKDKPSAQSELKRKLHAFRKFDDSTGEYYIPDEKWSSIYTVFLRCNRGDIDNDSLERDIREYILTNTKLLRSVGGEPSMLDTSHGELGFLSRAGESVQDAFIGHLIKEGLRTNMESSTSVNNLDKELRILLPILIKYLGSIYALSFSDLDLEKIRKVSDLAKWIGKKIWSEYTTGFDKKRAWFLVKSFFAWGGYQNILTEHIKAKEVVKNIPNRLQEIGFTVTDTKSEKFTDKSGEVVVSYSCSLKFGNIKIRAEYGVKSMESILLKLAENEEYNNLDAVRDIIRGAIIFNNSEPSSEKANIIALFANTMADKGYLLKDKGVFTIDDSTDKKSPNHPKDDSTGKKSPNFLKAAFRQSYVTKRPLGGIETRKGTKSSTGFKNTSLSGFSNEFSQDGSVFGFEWQFHTEDSAKFWHIDHYTYHPLKVVKGWSRGSWFITGKQLYNTVVRNIDGDVLTTILHKKIPDIIKEYIENGKILIYKGESGGIYLVLTDHQRYFEYKKSRTTKLITKDHTEYTGILSFVINNSGRSGVTEDTNPETTSENTSESMRIDIENPGMFAKKGEARPMK